MRVFVKGVEELGARCSPFGSDCSWTLLFVKTLLGGVGDGPIHGWRCRLGSSTIASNFVVGSCRSVHWSSSGKCT
ncbi:hypothetical protein Ancab_006527 [Ancistrocladus abbreviatus]